MIRFLWLALRRCWPQWKQTLAIIQPETVICWHREGFWRYWRWNPRRRAGRPSTTTEIRALVRRMAAENLTWGAPRIHGEIQKLGLGVSERTVSRSMLRRPAGRAGPRGERREDAGTQEEDDDRVLHGRLGLIGVRAV